MESFVLCFIPLFVAIDPVGTLPLFIALTNHFSASQKRKLAIQAVSTAFAAGILFGLAGQMIFSLLGITPADFRIAGGLLLVILSIRDIVGATPKTTEGSVADTYIGTVPLGVPLIAGPAMFTTLLILSDDHPFPLIMLALVANMLVALAFLIFSERIVNVIGEGSAKVIAKIIAIFLSAIGVMMVRKGIEALLLK